MDDPSPGAQRFVLDLPAAASHVSTARLFVATVARTLGVDEDRVDDLKLAVSEAISAVVQAGGPRAHVAIVATDDGDIEVTVGPVSDVDLVAPGGAGPDPITVIAALFPGVEIEDRAIRFSSGGPALSP